MDISNISNTPVSFPIGKNVYNVSRLSLLELFAEFEVEAKKDYIDDVNVMAATIKDKVEKLDFMVKMMRDMPNGIKLEERARDKMNSMSGGLKVLYTALKKHNKITYDDIVGLSSDTSLNAQISAIVEYTLGNDIRSKDDAEKKI